MCFWTFSDVGNLLNVSYSSQMSLIFLTLKPVLTSLQKFPDS